MPNAKINLIELETALNGQPKVPCRVLEGARFPEKGKQHLNYIVRVFCSYVTKIYSES